MATLVSPGVAVSVTDDSVYVSSGPGTVPLIFITTAENKATPDGTSVAAGTLRENAERLFLITSQRELMQTFGEPNFNQIGGSAQHGYPLNEYGLLAAHSYMGIANRVYVMRANIDLAALEPTVEPPTAPPANNTYWVDTANYVPGLFRFTGGEWVQVTVSPYVNSTELGIQGSPQPAAGFVNEDHIVVFNNDSTVSYFYRDMGEWVEVGTQETSFISPHTQVPVGADGDYWLKTTRPNNGLNIPLYLYSASASAFQATNNVQVFADHTAFYAQFASNATPAGTVGAIVEPVTGFTLKRHNGGSQVTVTGSVPFTTLTADVDLVINATASVRTIAAQTEANFNNTAPNGTFVGGDGVGGTAYVAGNTITLSDGTVVTVDAVDVDGDVTEFTITQASATGFASAATLTQVSTDGTGTAFTLTPGTANEAPFSISLLNTDTLDDVIEKISAANVLNIVANKTVDNRLVISNVSGRDISITGSGLWETFSGIVNGDYSNLVPLNAAAPVYVASPTQPRRSAADGAYWYNPSFDIDVMVNDGSGDWIEFPFDIYVQPDEPFSPSTGDLWVETDQVDAYPVIWRRTAGGDWQLIDNADQTTPRGIVFADARVAPLATLDADAPNPLLYPGDTLLWNTRYSGRNVKVFRQDYTFEGTLIGDRWVNASGNREDGRPYMGLDAVRRVVVIQLQSVVISNENIRADSLFYNLIAAPGFPELIDEMVVLNQDRKEQAFIIGDTPFKLSDNSTALQNWATNANLAPTNGAEGLVSSYPYLGVYYPSGFTTNTDGSEVVVPPSHMMLRVMAYNDQVSYPWFAPAGFARGTVTNATSVGYINAEDEFVPITLNEGQRDVLYINKLNPITVMPGRGLVVYGQKTRNPVDSALDRVNVARLINYIRYQAERLAQPFLFEPNDSITRAAVKNAFDTFLAELITLRGLFDFLVVCDTSNNTPARIDRNELWVDIAIQPIKAIEFIYIPIRLQNTGADLAG